MITATIEQPTTKSVSSPASNYSPLYKKCLDFQNWDHPYLTLDRRALREQGISEYKDLSSLKIEGIEVVSHEKVPESTLKYLRYGKIGATAGAVVLNLAAALGLFYSGAKLFFNSFKSDVESSYKSLGNAYSASAVAGALTGAAHESPEWSIGNIGMGLFSRKLNTLWGLAGFSISEGLASIGMGKVRYRDKRNVSAVRNSIFNNPALSKLRFLMPIEQAILTFVKKIISPKNWNRFREEEPYSVFQTAGGGLIAGGGILAIGSLFKNKLSEAVKSFFYLPYSLFSSLNLLAFYRDGEVQLGRLKKFAKRPGEAYPMKAEGLFKKFSTPFLALNNILLALKGVGVDSEGGLMYNLAMAARAWGAGLAFLAFKSQSMLKFFKPDLFGPKYKEKIELDLDVQKRAEVVFKHLENLEKNRPKPHEHDKFDDIIDRDSEQRDILRKLISTPTYRSGKYKTQVGLPTPLNPPINGRPYLERFTHGKRVCGTDILIYNALLKNTADENLRSLLLENKEAFKIAGLLHDVGHIARSHLAEKAVKGHDNDEYTLDILEGTKEGVPKDIHDTVCSHYGKEKGEKILKQAQDIIGIYNPLYKAYKICDYVEYLRCGDFTCIDGFPKWSTKDIEEYADTVRLYKGKDDKIKTCFTEAGAILTFIILFDRKIFNDAFNYFPITCADEQPYLLGLDAADVSEKEIKQMTESQVDEYARKGLTMLKNANFQFRLRHTTGGENAYCGYSKYDPDKKILVYMGEDKEPMEFLEYVEKVVKPRDERLYKELEPRIYALTTPKEVDLIINVRS